MPKFPKLPNMINVAALSPFSSRQPNTGPYNMKAPNSKLGNIYLRDFERDPAPIVSLSVGSAGMKRTALWTQKMRALGCDTRIQSLVVYDCYATKRQGDDAWSNFLLRRRGTKVLQVV